MNKNRHRQSSEPSRPDPRRSSQEPGRAPGRLPLALRFIFSLLLLWHLSAVFLAPFAIVSASPELPPDSPQLARDLAQSAPMQWYLDALYINHGYSFFAPNPGEGYLIRYEVLDERGQTIAEGEFPNRIEQWPRLRYHRHFMLTDQVPPTDWPEAERLADIKLKAYARHLVDQYDGFEARVVRIRHDLLSPQQRQQGAQLDDEGLYVTVDEAVQTRRDVERVKAERLAREAPGDAQSATYDTRWNGR